MYFYLLLKINVKNTFYILFSVLLFSCGNKQEKTQQIQEEKPLLSVVKKYKAPESIKPIFLKEVASWQELNNVNSFLKKFKKASPNEVLSNALELRDLVKSLKDSVTPAIFNTPSFKTRINVLNNETLRLADLTFISAIKTEEINVQVNKTIAAFSAVNSKINIMLSKKRFEDAIDVNIDFIGIDSTKIDSVSKKSINDKKKEEFLKKRSLLNEKIPTKSKKKI